MAKTSARYAYEGLSRVLHEKARLSIMTSLMSRPEGLVFNDLKALCALTDGNLNRHILVLHEAGLVEVWKGSDKGRAQTRYRLTRAGRQRFVEYLGELEKVIQDALTAPRTAGKKAGSVALDMPPGWVPA